MSDAESAAIASLLFACLLGVAGLVCLFVGVN